MSKQVPVIWNIDFNEVLGAAVVDEETGEVAIKLTDPKIVRFIAEDKKRTISAVSMSVTPGFPRIPNG